MMSGLLLNEHLPAKLSQSLADGRLEIFHVSDLGLNGKSDREIWNACIARNLVICTKDSDYLELLTLSDSGRVLLLLVGNMRLHELQSHLFERREQIISFCLGAERLLALK